MTVPSFFYSNIDSLYPLLGNSEPLHDLLVPSPFSSGFTLSTSAWGKACSVMWLGMNSSTGSISREQLTSALKRTMEVFSHVLHSMNYYQEIYQRSFTSVLNGSQTDTSDLEKYRSELKVIYEGVGPFIKKLKNADTPVANELIEILFENSKEEKDFTKKFSRELLNCPNKQIAAMISLECANKEMLPYGPLLLGMYTADPVATEIAQRIIPRICSLVDFKIARRALELIHTHSSIKLPEFSSTFYNLFKKNIPIVLNPEKKWDSDRRALMPGYSVVIEKGAPPVKLGAHLSPPKAGHDGRIGFHITNATGSSTDTTSQVIFFYVNREYGNHLAQKQSAEGCLASAQPFIARDHVKFRWAIEAYIETPELPFSQFVSFVSSALSKEHLSAVDFTKINVPKDSLEIKTTEPIYFKGTDYAGFIESLIGYYKAGVYNKEQPSLYLFLSTCLANAKEEHVNFFKTLATDTLKLPLTALQSDIDVVKSAAVGRKKTISPIAESNSAAVADFEKKCQTMVTEILELRKNLVLELRHSKDYTKSQETALITNLLNTFPEKVRSWIIPPP